MQTEIAVEPVSIFRFEAEAAFGFEHGRAKVARERRAEPDRFRFGPRDPAP